MTKIVLAEDDKLISASLCDALTSAGYDVTPAYDGEQAVTKVKEIKPDLLLLDIMMPKLDGISVMWEIKSDPACANTRVLVLTNLGDMDTVSKILAAGATDYLLKSDQSVTDVQKKIEEILARQITIG